MEYLVLVMVGLVGAVFVLLVVRHQIRVQIVRTRREAKRLLDANDRLRENGRVISNAIANWKRTGIPEGMDAKVRLVSEEAKDFESMLAFHAQRVRDVTRTLAQRGFSKSSKAQEELYRDCERLVDKSDMIVKQIQVINGCGSLATTVSTTECQTDERSGR